MGPLRPSESFERVYSAPEPPKVARRPKLLALLVAGVSFVVAAVVVFMVAPDDGERPQTARPSSGPSQGGGEAVGGETGDGQERAGPGAGGEPGGGPSAPESSAPPQAVPLASLPEPCGSVKKETVERLVPGAKPSEISVNSTLTTCTYSSVSGGFRWLRVEGRLYESGRVGTPLQTAEQGYESGWKQAHQDGLARTVRLERRPGMGDAAYVWFKVDKGQPTVIGQVVVRFRNVVATVGYSERVQGGQGAEARERACLAKAAEVAREVVSSLG